MTDRTTKLLLGLIAAGLWANAAASWLPPKDANAQGPAYLAVDHNIRSIDEAAKSMQNTLSRIAGGHCPNNKIC